jgi:hypothetical protein
MHMLGMMVVMPFTAGMAVIVRVMKTHDLMVTNLASSNYNSLAFMGLLAKGHQLDRRKFMV